jgi:hypothetical protein
MAKVHLYRTFVSNLRQTYDEDLQVELKSSVGNTVPAKGTDDESNITSITASSSAARELSIPSNTASSVAANESNIPLDASSSNASHESNIHLITASSIAAQNEYITIAMVGNAIEEEQVNNQNANDKGLLILNELDLHQQNKYIDNKGLNFQPDCTDYCFDSGKRIIKCDHL